SRVGVRARDRLPRRGAPPRGQGARARTQARRLPDDRAGNPASGDADRGRWRGDVGLALADARGRNRPRLCSGGGESTRNRAHYRRARTATPCRGRRETDLQARGDLAVPATESYPDDLLYHREHDWARIDGDEAVMGVTWYAVDALGELVHYEPPAEGASVRKDEPYGEVESVKAVSDLVAPLSGEVLEVNAKVVSAPETVNEDPYGDGWLIRIRLSDPGEVSKLLDLDGYRKVLDEA